MLELHHHIPPYFELPAVYIMRYGAQLDVVEWRRLPFTLTLATRFVLTRTTYKLHTGRVFFN